MRALYILWLRQIKRFARSKSRIVGSIGQPLLFLLALGYGLGSVFRQAGHGDYIEFLVPGIITQTILFSAIFWGINILFDKRFGFLKETLVVPVSRFKVLLGSALGGATAAVFQGVLVFFISLFLGFHPHHWWMVPGTFAIMALLALALSSFGAGVAAMVDDMQGFQLINQFLVFPLYFLSGAIYPVASASTWLRWIANVNPISYAVDALRDTLIGQTHYGLAKDLVVLGAVTTVLLAFGTYRFRHLEA